MNKALASLFGSEVKAKVLRALLLDPLQAHHLRGLATVAGVESGNALKALRGLLETGVVKVVPDARGARYQADERSPFFSPLRQLFVVSGALVADLKEVAARLPADQVLVFGSVAKGTDGPDSDVDVLVIGNLSSIEAQAAFKAVARKHRREVSVLTVGRSTFAEQLAQGSPFWRGILDNEVIMLKGDKLDAPVGAPAVH